MKKEEISEILNNIDLKHIEDAEDYTEKAEKVHDLTASAGKKPVTRFKWAFAAAAAVVLLIVAGSAFFAIRAEAKEYNKAMEFFKANGLSTEGLNRSEIKAVYNDIVTKSFTYGKTAEVIAESIPGYAIDKDSLSPEELAALWESNTAYETTDIYGYSYRCEYKRNAISHLVDKTTVICSRSGVVQWCSSFPGLQLTECNSTENGVLILGYIVAYHEKNTPCVVLLDNKGTLKWQYNVNHGLSAESLTAILPGEGGMFDVFTTFIADNRQERILRHIRLDANGNESNSKDIMQGPYNYMKVIRFGDGFLMQIGEWYNGDPDSNARFIMLDSAGNKLGEVSYTADNCKYYIQDMTEFGGQLYLSAYAVPLKSDGSGKPCLDFSELHKYLEETYGDNDLSLHGADITEFMKRNHTAVLLICDPADATPRLFYSVKEAFVSYGSLFINGSNELEWTIGTYEYVEYSPFSSQMLSISNRRCSSAKYCFGTTGDLLRIIDTGEEVPLFR